MRIHSATSTIVAIDATVPVGSLTVHAFPRAGTPSLTLTPQVPGDALAERAINDAQITETDGTLRLVVSRRLSTVGTGTGDVHNSVTGTITGVVISCRDVTGDAVSAFLNADMPPGRTPAPGAITAELDVSIGTHADLTSTTGTITTHGKLGAVTANTDDGDVDIDSAITAAVTTTDGAITTGPVRQVDAHTATGNIHIGLVIERADLITVNGNIHISGAETDAVTASTVNGNIEITQAPGIRVAASAIRSITGRVWVY